VGLAIFAAEALPVLLLVIVVVLYGLVRQSNSPTPEEFAPQAGNWVGPIGGFFATLFFSFWVARRASANRFAHGTAVGVGTALLDLALGFLLGGAAAASLVFLISNAGRILAGILGGALGARDNRSQAARLVPKTARNQLTARVKAPGGFLADSWQGGVHTLSSSIFTVLVKAHPQVHSKTWVTRPGPKASSRVSTCLCELSSLTSVVRQRGQGEMSLAGGVVGDMTSPSWPMPRGAPMWFSQCQGAKPGARAAHVSNW
jgi:hypothetical protein